MVTEKARKTILGLIPLTAEFSTVWNMVVAAITSLDAVPLRLDEQRYNEPIETGLFKRISECDAVVADLTFRNANVMFELGVAQAIGKPTVLIGQLSEPLPFDIAAMRVLIYEPAGSGRDRAAFIQALQKELRRALEDPSAFTKEVHSQKEPSHVFVSYSHIDVAFLNRLLVHLKPLERAGRIDLFADTYLRAGDKWRDEIKAALQRARVAILLVSADFLASDFIVNDELPPLLQRAEKMGTRIVPIILKPCRFVRDRSLRDFQAVNDPALPLVNMADGRQEETYDRVAQLVEDLVVR